jgi:hypothetical protein
MEEEHALELERLEQGGDPWPGLALPVRRRRLRNYLVFAVIFSVVALGFIYWAFTFEDTAITTIPQVTRDVFVPLATAVP